LARVAGAASPLALSQYVRRGILVPIGKFSETGMIALVDTALRGAAFLS
jgi:hypothetical protein